jgi:DNA-directed RNA polymerase sigma subunit (sigma70/sigma32)
MKTINRRPKDYDLELAVLEAMRPHPTFTFTGCEIAAACGTSRQNIDQLTNRALRKIRRAVLPALSRAEIREEMRCLA